MVRAIFLVVGISLAACSEPGKEDCEADMMAAESMCGDVWRESFECAWDGSCDGASQKSAADACTDSALASGLVHDAVIGAWSCVRAEFHPEHMTDCLAACG